MSIAERLATALHLEPLPGEGGWFRRTHADDTASHILFLVGGGEFSELHRLTAPERYDHLAGAPLSLLQINGNGLQERTLGPGSSLTVPAGSWQGSSSDGDWTLVTTTVTPAFTWDMFTLADPAALADLVRQWPAARTRIEDLSRSRP